MLSIYKNYRSLINVFLFTSLIAVVMVILRVIYVKNFNYLFLPWNLFLAWIPLIISLFISYLAENQPQNNFTRKIIGLGIIWLLFFPNAPYIVTDFIHISINNYYSISTPGMKFNNNSLIWYDFILISLYAWLGFLLGYVSLYQIQKLIMNSRGRILSWLMVILVSLLSGFGIYLGRFLRLNTWDILNPVSLIINIMKNINLNSLFFSSIYGLFIILVYLILYQLIFLNKDYHKEIGEK